jgi:hypothetical protein
MADMTLRDTVAMHVLCTLIPQKGNDADEYEDLACLYAEDLAKAACKRWGHRSELVKHGETSSTWGYHCVRCGADLSPRRRKSKK